MLYDTAQSVASSWVGLFASVWFARDAHRVSDDHRVEPTHNRPVAPRHPINASRGSKRRQPTKSHDGKSGDASVERFRSGTNWERVDLYVRRPKKSGSRFDGTVALPVDAPRILEDTVQALSLRLLALPPMSDLNRRSAQYRAQVERTLAEVRSAQTRLRAGSYGLCESCSSPISLARLTDKPWSQTCIKCALGI
jgi:hypothetical protein